MFKFYISFLALIVTSSVVFGQQLTDRKATTKTQNLYHHLLNLETNQVMFGHQDGVLYGLDWKYGLRSDVEMVSGDRAAVVGWDIGKIGAEVNIDSFSFKQIIKGIRHVYKAGGINTISWHMDNPINGDNAWSKISNTTALLPGGEFNFSYVQKLDEFARFIRKCRVGLFTRIPIVFRPFHEHNGDWFWWSKAYNTEDEYIALWQYTIDYLRKEKGIHNLIVAFSPDRSRMDINWEGYHYGYPGDEYVDVIGLDNYWDLGYKQNTASADQQLEDFRRSITLISEIANKRNKVAALTETGNETIAIPDWYTQRLLEPIKSSGSRLAWVLVWRNANMGHFYVPYKGHQNEMDFVAFEKDEATLFLDNINNPYKRIK